MKRSEMIGIIEDKLECWLNDRSDGPFKNAHTLANYILSKCEASGMLPPPPDSEEVLGRICKWSDEK